MIDTVKFKIPTTNDFRLIIEEKCAKLEKSRGQESIFRVTKDVLNLGSYDRKVTVGIDQGDNVYVEFSVPKYFLGNNIYLLRPQFLEMALDRLYPELEAFFGGFPHYIKWSVQRLDVCYAWQLQDDVAVDNAINLLKTFAFPRKQPYSREGALMYVGSAYSVKFYDKQKEYRKNDFKELQKEIKNIKKIELAYELLEKSKGVLRFEATLRKAQVEFEYGRAPIYKDIMDETKIIELLNKYLNKFLRNLNTKTMTESEIHDKLISKYGKTRGIQLFQFYVLYFSKHELHRKFLLQNYHRTQISYNLKMIAKADVGISDKDTGFNFDFSIPSKDVVYTPDFAPAAAGA